MNNNLRESLSALMDNEADALELRRILRELEGSGTAEGAAEGVEGGKGGESEGSPSHSPSQELLASWSRYHLISASLKQEIHSNPSCDLLADIRARLDQEPVPVKSPGLVASAGNRKTILRVLGQGAIAASVALAVLFTADMVMVADNTGGTDSTAAELADNNAGDSQLPALTGEMNPSTETRVAVQPGLSEEEMDRLKRVVSEELEDSLQRNEIPATFVPEENR